MSEYADPDLETVAPLPPGPVRGAVPPSMPSGRGPGAAIVAAMVVVSLLVGFGVATVVLNARDKGSDSSATSPLSPSTPSSPGATVPSTTPNRVPADRNAGALGEVILRQSDVPAADSVVLLGHGADLTVATLDLCNGTFASETQRTARRQVALVDSQSNVVLSTEAVLYGKPSGGAQAFDELRSVAAHCPSTPVKSPVGEDTATTIMGAAPDGAWPRTPSVERLAYDFHTTDAITGDRSHSIAVYLRRGRALMGVYFNQPDGAQVAVDAKTTVAGIVAVFESRLAKLPASVVNG